MDRKKKKKKKSKKSSSSSKKSKKSKKSKTKASRDSDSDSDSSSTKVDKKGKHADDDDDEDDGIPKVVEHRFLDRDYGRHTSKQTHFDKVNAILTENSGKSRVDKDGRVVKGRGSMASFHCDLIKLNTRVNNLTTFFTLAL
jgi:hypothetical protein